MDFSPEEIIARLGGTKATADKLEVPASTVANWPARKRIPGKYWPKILALLGLPEETPVVSATSRK